MVEEKRSLKASPGLLTTYLELLGDLRGQAARTLALGTLAGLLEGVALTALFPLLSLGQIDRSREVMGLAGTRLAVVAASFFVIVAGLASLTRALSQRGILRVRAEVDRRMRTRSLKAIMEVDWSIFHMVGESDIAESVLAEGERTADGLQSGMHALSGIGAVVALYAFAVVVAPAISLVTTLIGLIGALAYQRLSRHVQGQRHQVRDETAAAVRQAMDLATAAKYLRSTGDAGEMTIRVEESFETLARSTYRVGSHVAVSRFWVEAGAALFLGALLLASAFSGRFTAATLIFLALFYRVVPRVVAFHEGVAQAGLQVHWYHSWKERIDTLSSNRMELPRGPAPGPVNVLELRRVGFTYPGASRTVLREISIRIEEGEFIAIVGRSGSGKTTMLDLLSGLLRPTAGAVLVGGISLHDLDLLAWQRRIGLMLQDTPLRQGTVLDNIVGRLPADLPQARRCAQVAEVDEFVSALPLGYGTLVGERGSRLSGGERQRIALARALYREPLLLLLDEPTSALDPVAEASIVRSLVRIKGGCTIVLVAHRLTTVRHADRILVLDDGIICQTGTWEELERQSGPFTAMLREQADPAVSVAHR